MGASATSLQLKRFALLIMFSVSTGSQLLAQSTQETEPNLEAALKPGLTVWITDVGGQEEKAQIVGLSGGIVTTTTGTNLRRLRTTDVVRVRVRDSDPLLNGALIGAAAAVASGLLLCRLTEPWENCRDDFGPMVRIGAIGAGVGIGIDALIRGRRTIYEAAKESGRLRATPIIAPHGGGTPGLADFLTERSTIPNPGIARAKTGIARDRNCGVVFRGQASHCSRVACPNRKESHLANVDLDGLSAHLRRVAGLCTN